MTSQPNLPRPYLTREETNRQLEKLGFRFHPDGTLDTYVFDNKILYQKIVLEKLQALETLIAGAIAEWADVKDDFGSKEEDGEQTPEAIEAELQEWTEEYLVG